MRLLSLLSAVCGAMLAALPLAHAAIAPDSAASPSSTLLCSTDLECSMMAAGLIPLPSHLTSNLTLSPSPTPSPTPSRFHPTAYNAAADGLKFTLVTADTPWTGRAMASLHVFTKPISFREADSGEQRTFPTSLIMFGGWVPLTFADTQNDVWASSNLGRDWSLISGRTLGRQAQAYAAESSFTDTYNAGSASVQDPVSQAIYKLGGLLNSPMGAEVWRTTNAVQWVEQSAYGREPYHSSGFYPAVTANSKGRLIEATGGDRTTLGNDVWMTTDSGRNWRLQTDKAPYAARYAQASMSWQSASALSGADVMWIIGGQTSYDNLNDVWATSDEGKTWAVINAAGPFPQRHLGGSAVTRDGVLILAGGFADEIPGGAPATLASIQNDVWVSMDGGYSWGRCVQDAEWDDRYLEMVAVGPDGYLYVGGGVQYDTTRVPVFTSYTDLWKSSISFLDLPAVAKACGVTIPSCGTGLRCWPGADTVKATDGSYVSCAACPYEGLGWGGSMVSKVVVGVMVTFIVISVLAVAAIVWLVMKMRKGGVLGGGDAGAALWSKMGGETKGDTNGLADGLYHQHEGTEKQSL